MSMTRKCRNRFWPYNYAASGQINTEFCKHRGGMPACCVSHCRCSSCSCLSAKDRMIDGGKTSRRCFVAQQSVELPISPVDSLASSETRPLTACTRDDHATPIAAADDRCNILSSSSSSSSTSDGKFTFYHRG